MIAPASTLHNWQQEITRFVPGFKVNRNDLIILHADYSCFVLSKGTEVDGKLFL